MGEELKRDNLELSSDLEPTPEGGGHGTLMALYNSPTIETTSLSRPEVRQPSSLDLDQTKLMLLSQQAGNVTPLAESEAIQQQTANLMGSLNYLPTLLASYFAGEGENKDKVDNNDILNNDFGYALPGMEDNEWQRMNELTNPIPQPLNTPERSGILDHNDPKSFFDALTKQPINNMNNFDTKNRLRRSPVYAYFTFLNETGEGIGYRCKLCGHTYQSFSSTTTFFKHLRRKHKIDLRDNTRKNLRRASPNSIDKDNSGGVVGNDVTEYNNLGHNLLQQYNEINQELDNIKEHYLLQDHGTINEEINNYLSRIVMKLNEELLNNPLVKEGIEQHESYNQLMQLTFNKVLHRLDRKKIQDAMQNSFDSEKIQSILEDDQFVNFLNHLQPSLKLNLEELKNLLNWDAPGP